MFFRIIMEQGIAKEKALGKIMEINQCMVLFENDMMPLYRDKEFLKKSKYKIAILKLAFLRLIRRSFIGRSSATGFEQFKMDVEKARRVAS